MRVYDGGVGTDRAVVKARTELWFAWGEIAGEQEMVASGWRASALVEMANDRSPAPAMSQETKAAVAAIAAAGATLETFGRNVAQFGVSETPGKGAAGVLLSNILHVFPEAPITEELKERVAEVFEWRNRTLHYVSEFEELGPHPIGLKSTWVARTFTSEAASACVDAVADLITATTRIGRSPIPEAEWWAIYCQDVGKKLRSRHVGTVPLDITP